MEHVFPPASKVKAFIFAIFYDSFFKISWFSSIPPLSSPCFMFHTSLLVSVLTVIYMRMSTLLPCVSHSCSLFPPSPSLSIRPSLFPHYSPSFPPNPTHSRQPPIQTFKYNRGCCLIKAFFFFFLPLFLISYTLINTAILAYSTNTCFVYHLMTFNNLYLNFLVVLCLFLILFFLPFWFPYIHDWLSV